MAQIWNYTDNSMTDSDPTLLERAFPGENYILQRTDIRTDMTCKECHVHWVTRIDGTKCWVCGKEGVNRYNGQGNTHPYAMAMAMAVMGYSDEV